MTSSEDTSFPRLVSLACHDLRTPLATVQGFARTLIRTAQLEDPAARYVGLIDAASEQLAELLEELALAARIQAGRYDPVLVAVDSLELAREAAASVEAGEVRVTGDGGAVMVDREATAHALSALARCALRHGGLQEVSRTVDAETIELAPIRPSAARVIVGEELRDFGAAVAVRLLGALGGSAEVSGETLVVRLPREESA